MTFRTDVVFQSLIADPTTVCAALADALHMPVTKGAWCVGGWFVCRSPMRRCRSFFVFFVFSTATGTNDNAVVYTENGGVTGGCPNDLF